ncbi:hypothetical protein ABG067_005864 [Albugo candida]
MDDTTLAAKGSDADERKYCVPSLIRDMEGAILESDAQHIGLLKDRLSQIALITLEESKMISDIILASKYICEGKYIKVLQSHWICSQSSTRSVDFVHDVICFAHDCIRRSTFPLLTSYQILLQGIALLNVFTQINYTGPALSTHELEILTTYSNAFIESKARDTINYRSFACVALQVDGEYPYNTCGRLEILLLARCLLQAVGNWSQSSWIGSIQCDEEVMKIVRQVTSASCSNQTLRSKQPIQSETHFDQNAVVTLDQADPENILLEQIQFEDDTRPEREELLVIDQIILLALCLDVKNNNPNDILTREEMMAYIACVLEQPNNWMVHATALLERAWLECQTSKRRERAVLQIQALVDQHSTQLATPSSLEDMTPAIERMAHVYALAFPPQFALKKDLAERYFALGAAASALELFKELEIWDEVIICYRILDQQKKAEALVRERIMIEPTPYLWCCLGDLTGEMSHFEAAWELSEHRYPRAKRSLGRAAFEANDIPSAIKHFEESLRIHPMHMQTWFLLGVLGMRASDWNLGLQSFTRVVQLDPDNAEAWGNIGSIHMTQKHFAEAFSVFQEAVKQKRFMWQIWENLAWCAVEIGKYGDAIYAQHQLLDLRSKHNRPVDHELLAWLVNAIVFENEGVLQSHYKDELAKLLGRITSVATNNSKLWQVYAHFNDGVGRQEKALECRLKVSRTLQTANWEKDEEQVVKVCDAALQVAAGYQVQASKKALHAARLFLRGVLKKAQINFPHLEICVRLEEALQDIQLASEAIP